MITDQVTNRPSKGATVPFADASLPSRREFLRRFSTGLLVWVVLRQGAGAEVSEAAHPVTVRPKPTGDFNAFLHIDENGHVTCFTGKIEMGQGPITSLPQMLAEDLDVSMDDISMVMGDTDLCPFDQGTWGSQTTQAFGTVWRTAAAKARGALLDMASETLQVPVSQLSVQSGVVFDTKDPARRVTYGQLTKGKRIERKVAAKPNLKAPDQFRIIGKPLLRKDSRDKVTGRAIYAGDVRLPGNALRPRAARSRARGDPQACRHLGDPRSRRRCASAAARPGGRPARASRRRGRRAWQAPRRV